MRVRNYERESGFASIVGDGKNDKEHDLDKSVGQEGKELKARPTKQLVRRRAEKRGYRGAICGGEKKENGRSQTDKTMGKDVGGEKGDGKKKRKNRLVMEKWGKYSKTQNARKSQANNGVRSKRGSCMSEPSKGKKGMRRRGRWPCAITSRNGKDLGFLGG